MKTFAVLFITLLLPFVVSAQSLQDWVDANCERCSTRMSDKTGVYILERGEEALMARAWLAQNATTSIDVQYFIWSTDNIGILAAEMLLGAADRGVTVRVLVDDFLIDANDRTLVMLAAHDNVDIRIYNPTFSVGTSGLGRIKNAIMDFRGVNQRMHDKTAIFDGIAGITGGRNMADEYFDFDHDYNFRDRDALLLGKAVADMRENFDEFWENSLAVPVEDLLTGSGAEITDSDIERHYAELRAYATDPANFEAAIRDAINNMPQQFPLLLNSMPWEDARFISDDPGKNSGEEGLGGGGVSTSELIDALANAKHSVLIQSPYLILPKGGVQFLEALHQRGVRIRISTNSLASTDNLAAFVGYFGQRPSLLNAGVELYEFKPHPEIQTELVRRYPALAHKNPIFAIHAKSMVIDDKLIYIGTFNLDPRSANLNTEVGVLVESAMLGAQLSASIEQDIEPGNSWRTTHSFNPDREVDRSKRIELWLANLIPMEPIL